MHRILLTNDDGIDSYCLWAAAEPLSLLGEVTIVAPAGQWSGAGRSLPRGSAGKVEMVERAVNGKRIAAFSVEASPAQAVVLALLELMPARPDLVVSGINYGENIGTSVTISGTVGAALEAAAAGIPALAISLQTAVSDHHANSAQMDFSVAAHFGKLFAEKILLRGLPWSDVDVIKVDVPALATAATPWKVTRVSRLPYYVPVRAQRDDGMGGAALPYIVQWDPSTEPDSDAHALRVEQVVSVSPLSIDLTSRVDLESVAQYFSSDPRLGTRE
jgi:5'-nucleotidase